MDNPEIQGLIDEYLRRLDNALGGLPTERRDQLVAEVRQHIDDACAAEPELSRSGVRTILDKVGDPDDIAAAALEDALPELPRRRVGRTGWIAIGAAAVIVLVVIGLKVVVSPAPNPNPAGRLPQTVTPQTVTLTRIVPNVVGLEVPRATATLSAAGLRSTAVNAAEAPASPGEVVAQTPAAGSRIPVGSTVFVSVAQKTPTNSIVTTTTIVTP